MVRLTGLISFHPSADSCTAAANFFADFGERPVWMILLQDDSFLTLPLENAGALGHESRLNPAALNGNADPKQAES